LFHPFHPEAGAMARTQKKQVEQNHLPAMQGLKEEQLTKTNQSVEACSYPLLFEQN